MKATVSFCFERSLSFNFSYLTGKCKGEEREAVYVQNVPCSDLGLLLDCHD